jgi:PAS domain S-box-containing protein
MSRSTVFDNSERRKAELSLRESEEQNRLLFEESPEAVILFDKDGKMLRMNRAFENITGLPGEKFIGQRIEETRLLSGDQVTRLSDFALGALRHENDTSTIEFKLMHASGELRDISTRVFALKLQGQPHYLASMHDITTSKRAEETLRLANAEMERALRLKDEFLANMSHELRTPLNAILGITESLLEQISGPLNEKQQKYLQTVLESAQHLLELINDILDLAKVNAGRIDLDINKVDVAAIAQTSLRMIRELAQKKGLNVKLEIDKSVKIVAADERRLKQMLVNLLSNAVKFTPKGGNIGLDIRGDHANNNLLFTVWDTGIGIKKENLRMLFQPFVQLDAGLARGSQGTGLGLVLVSQMARLHGGSVTVESEPDKGSRFIVTIPWASTAQFGSLSNPQASALAPIVQPASVPQRSATILLVEDTESVTMLINDYLNLHGYHVIIAKDGFEGIARTEENKPDLILMDVMMPEMDGLETTRRIRSQLGLVDVPIIALTALAMTGDRERCLAAGMNDYLSKPIKLRELLDIIERHLNLKQGGPNE